MAEYNVTITPRPTINVDIVPQSKGIVATTANAGPPGKGVPRGGDANQVLVKIDGDDYNTEWADQSGGFSGDYDDLTNKPFIPSKTSDLTNDSDFITIDDVNYPVTSVNTKTGSVVLDKTDIGLSNVDNTSDADKPISTDTQDALDEKANSADLATVATSGDYDDLINKPVISYPVISVNSKTGVVVLNKTDIGLSDVDNTSDVDKPISDDTQDALNLKADISSLATVATTGVYNDLTGKPSIPTNLDSLTDVVITTPTTDQILKYDGTNWINSASPPALPNGGTVDQVLTKNSSNNGDASWKTIYIPVDTVAYTYFGGL